jgi:hypothetical protein
MNAMYTGLVEIRLSLVVLVVMRIFGFRDNRELFNLYPANVEYMVSC